LPSGLPIYSWVLGRCRRQKEIVSFGVEGQVQWLSGKGRIAVLV
jgi:hypothetical protein